MSLGSEFKEFAMKGNVIDLAVGVVIGAAFGKIVASLVGDVVMPPLGLITVAALCPASWQIRLLDRAFEDLRDEDLLWADLGMVSAMHAQRADTLSILSRARAYARIERSGVAGARQRFATR